MLKLKSLEKVKEELIYNNCRELNKIKGNIKEIEDEIKCKQMEIRQKIVNG